MMASRFVALALMLSCSDASMDGVCESQDGTCDQTSLIQVKSIIELGTERGPDIVEGLMAAQAAIPQSEIDALAITGNDSAIDMAMKKAQATVYDGQKAAQFAISDEKVANANAYVQKFATDVAKLREKRAQEAHDAKKAKRYNAARRSAKAKNMAIEAAMRAKAREEAFNASQNASLRAQLMAEAAMNQTIKRQNALHEAMKMQRVDKFKYDTTKSKAYRDMLIADARDALGTAETDADSAAMARAVSDMADQSAQEAAYWAKLNATAKDDAHGNLTAAMDKARKAYNRATSAAWHYRDTQKKIVKSNISNAPNLYAAINSYLPANMQHHSSSASAAATTTTEAPTPPPPAAGQATVTSQTVSIPR